MLFLRFLLFGCVGLWWQLSALVPAEALASASDVVVARSAAGSDVPSSSVPRSPPYTLYDLTSSGLTEVWPRTHSNARRVGEAVRALNFGLVTVRWRDDDAIVTEPTGATVDSHSAAKEHRAREREGGQMALSARCHLSEKESNEEVLLEIYDGATGELRFTHTVLLSELQ
jgi:hypothetical protein